MVDLSNEINGVESAIYSLAFKMKRAGYPVPDSVFLPDAAPDDIYQLYAARRKLSDLYDAMIADGKRVA